MSNWTRSQTLKLIDLMQQHPSLYDVGHIDYPNRRKREAAFTGICDGLKEIRPEITINEIRAKIKTIRSQYLREKRNVEKSRRSGAGTDNVYQPKLWCYEMLGFLSTSKNSVTGTSNLIFEELKQTTDSNECSLTSYSEECSLQSADANSTSKRKLKSTLETSIQKSLELAGKFAEHLKEKKVTPHQNFGVFVEQELAGLPPHIFHDVKWKIMGLLKEAQERVLQDRDMALEEEIRQNQTGGQSSPASSDDSSSFSSMMSSTPKKVDVLRVQVLKKARTLSVDSGHSSTADKLQNVIDEVFDETDFEY